MSKVKTIKQPYLGIETDDDELHYLVGLKGEASVVIKITNSVIQYSGNPKDYDNFHSCMLNIIKILGEGHIIQKLDVFSKGSYNEDNSTEFLQKEYDKHFRGRTYNIINKIGRASCRERLWTSNGDA